MLRPNLTEQVLKNNYQETSIQVVQDLPPSIAVLVTENAWVQITGSDGTVIYENIMLPGEEFVLPQQKILQSSSRDVWICLFSERSFLTRGKWYIS